MSAFESAWSLSKDEPIHLQPSNTLARRARKDLQTDKFGESSAAYHEMMERIATRDAGMIPEPSRVPEAAPAQDQGFLSR